MLKWIVKASRWANGFRTRWKNETTELKIIAVLILLAAIAMLVGLVYSVIYLIHML